MMIRLKEILMCFALGAVAYGLIEIAFRGYTHWTMPLTAGCVLILFYIINLSKGINIWLRCLIGAFVITSFELGVGLIVNVRLGWQVWDYSDKAFNFMGQICPKFFAAWFGLSLPAFALCDFVSSNISKSGLIRRKRYKI